MITLGRRHTLRVLRLTGPGAYLDGKNLGDILLPGTKLPKGLAPEQEVDVFLYLDSEDRLVASTDMPLLMAGEFGCLKVVSFNDRLGAFLAWGLPKDLLLPRREITRPIRIGDHIVVHVGVDEKSNRLVASMRLQRHLDKEPATYRSGEKVDLLISSATDLGYKAIINNTHSGLLYRSELGVELQPGERVQGYVKAVREDGKVDLSLNAAGYKRIGPLSDQILDYLRSRGGTMSLSDESSPEEIRAVFGVSKKAFKQALGSLFRERAIIIGHRRVSLANSWS